ncbi:MAG: pentapeptide repeat-containing protein [Comamonadaceae bacterium]|nr:pentapeptide repeat-containing protein [Comamonadaceae bacterium]
MEKTLFTVERPGNDYSGMSFQNISMRDQKRKDNFFNGVDLVDSEIVGTDLSYCEFSEALMKNCSILSSNFSNSDFVNSSFEGCQFSDCIFLTGEWRNAKFRSCRFINCNFDRTTITLTYFSDCYFDDRSLQSMLHRAVAQNVFSNCEFPWPVEDEIFASRNFGIPCILENSGQIVPNTRISIEQLCLLNNQGKMAVTDLLDAMRGIFEEISRNGRYRVSVFEFMKNVVHAIATERKISPTSLIALEGVITEFSRQVEDKAVFNVIMMLIVEIRSMLFEICTSENMDAHAMAQCEVVRIQLHFDNTFDYDTIKYLVESILAIGHFPPDAIRIEKVEYGSTFVDLLPVVVIFLGPTLTVTNFTLRQATITVERIGELVGAVKKLMITLDDDSSGSGKSKTVREKQAGAIVDGKMGSKELAAARELMRDKGDNLVKLDTKVDIHFTIK